MDRQRAAEVLDVRIDATVDQVRVAYRRRARKLHPDAGGRDPALMAELNVAYRLMCRPSPSGTARRIDRRHLRRGATPRGR